jgi:hypothetical protein
MGKKNKGSSKRIHSLQPQAFTNDAVLPIPMPKPFTNLPKPLFDSFGLLYQLIEMRLNEERIKDSELVEWLLYDNDFNDEQLINSILLEMLLLKKRLKTVDRQKTTKKDGNYSGRLESR